MDLPANVPPVRLARCAAEVVRPHNFKGHRLVAPPKSPDPATEPQVHPAAAGKHRDHGVLFRPFPITGQRWALSAVPKFLADHHRLAAPIAAVAYLAEKRRLFLFFAVFSRCLDKPVLESDSGKR